jgi:NADH-quinone oxidoreductase subunit C
MDAVLKDIENRFQTAGHIRQRDVLAFVTVEKNKALSLVTWLKDQAGYTALTLLTAVDWIEEGVFQLTYLLNNPQDRTELGVRVMIDREEATMDSAHHLWESVQVYQRELKEMFGIDFPGSPRVDEEFILEGWDDIPPYRRDFDTKKYSEETYFPRPGRQTNDPAEYMKKKLYPND